MGVISITKLDLSLLLSLKINKGDNLWMLVAMISWTTYSLLLEKKKS